MTRTKVIAVTLLAVLVALGSASLFTQNSRGAITVATMQLTPTLGCPGQQIGVTIIMRAIANDAHAAAGTNGIKLSSYPEGLITSYTGSSFIVGDSVCAGDYVVTVEIPLLGAGVGNGQTKIISASTHFTVGGNGCPNLAPCRPVGGVVMPTNTLAIATPYLALAGLIVAVSAAVLVKKRRD